MPLSRRNFLKLGLASSTALALESEFNVLSKAFGMELETSGKDVSGGKEGRTIGKRTAVPGTCLQCGVTDGLSCYVEDGRLVKIEGSPKHPNTRGVICGKGQAGINQVYDPYRIKYPMKRTGKRGDINASWERISWEEAVDMVAEKLTEIRESGDPGKFAFHQGRNRFGDFTKRFVAAAGSAHYFEHTTICESSLKAGYIATFGQDLDASDAARAKYIISFGENIYEASYMHNPLAQRIAKARVANHAKMVVFDPRLSNTAGRADEWIPVKPGTDAAVILAMCNVIMQEGLADTKFIDEWTNYPSAKLADHLKPFTPDWAEEISGIPAETIKRIAIEFARSQPGYARAYNGISNHTNGAQNARCVVLLNIVVGNIDKPGGFCLMKNGGLGTVEPNPVLADVLKEIGAPDAKFPIEEGLKEKYPLSKYAPAHLMPHIMEELDYPIGLYMLHMYNPAMSNPDIDLWTKFLIDKEKIEFIVDFTPYMSETAALAVDLIIPDCSYLEKLHPNAMPAVEQFPFIHLYQPVIKPLYESKSMYDTMLAIAKKVPGMEKYFDFDTVEDFCKELVELKWGEGSWDRLVEDGVLIGSKYDPATYKSFDELTEDEVAKMRQFNTFKKTLDLAKLKSEGAQIPAGDGVIKDKAGKMAGIVKGGVAYKGFGTGSGLLEINVEKFQKYGHSALPTYVEISLFDEMTSDHLHLLTGKANVHTQTRTANCAWLMELNHYNPAWINTKTAENMGIEDGDDIEIESEFGVKRIKCKAHLTEGIHPKTIFMHHHLGHFAFGPLATKGRYKEYNYHEKEEQSEKEVWYAEDEWPGSAATKDPKGRDAWAWTPNWITANNEEHTDPIGAEYAWSDNIVKVRKIGGGE